MKKRNGWETNYYGGKSHYVDGKRHSVNDEPAIITAEGDRFWYKDDMRHRGGGLPSTIYFKSRGKYFHENGHFLTACECGEFAEKHCPTRKKDE